MEDMNWCYEKKEIKDYGALDFNNASLISAVANSSPAAKLGLEKGDYVLSVNGGSFAAFDPYDLPSLKEAKIHYRFYNLSKDTVIDVTANSIPLGFSARPSTQGIVNNLKQGLFNGWADLELLWERESWDALYRAGYLLLPDEVLNTFTKKISKKGELTAAGLYYGIALYEKGKEEKGISLIFRFINNEIQNYETSTHAIAYFYAYKWARKNKDIENSELFLEKANDFSAGEFNRISQEAKENGLSIVSNYNWQGESFPVSYSFKTLNNTKTVSLQETLQNMNDNELLPVCVMPSYRGNGPYDQAMGCYGLIYPHIAKRLKPMHIILDETAKREDRPYWYEKEELAQKNKIPFELLHDKTGETGETLELSITPVFYLLNKEAKIIYEGGLQESFDYWDSLSKI